MPQVDLNDAKTDFYDQPSSYKYVQLLYYGILLITGNDIGPQTNEEVNFCIYFLLIGAFVESIIFGGIASEMAKAGQG